MVPISAAYTTGICDQLGPTDKGIFLSNPNNIHYEPLLEVAVSIYRSRR